MIWPPFFMNGDVDLLQRSTSPFTFCSHLSCTFTTGSPQDIQPVIQLRQKKL